MMIRKWRLLTLSLLALLLITLMPMSGSVTHAEEPAPVQRTGALRGFVMQDNLVAIMIGVATTGDLGDLVYACKVGTNPVDGMFGRNILDMIASRAAKTNQGKVMITTDNSWNFSGDPIALAGSASTPWCGRVIVQ